MTENPEVSEAQRRAVREKYGPESAVAKPQSVPALSGLGWISAVGFALTVVAMFVVGSASSPGPLTMLFWPAMLTVGPTVGFLALIAYLATKAVITSRK